jgi:hypothetical protein
MHFSVFVSPLCRCADRGFANKAVPITGRRGMWDCEMPRIPNCLDNRLTDGGIGRAVLPRNNFFFSFWIKKLKKAARAQKLVTCRAIDNNADDYNNNNCIDLIPSHLLKFG